MTGVSLAQQRLPLFPITAQVNGQDASARLEIAACDLDQLAGQFGTPLYVFDRATLDDSLSAYRAALARHYPGPAGITYAGKAFLCTAIAQWAGQHGLWVDCTGRGEIHIAASAGLPRSQILVHGVNKSPADLEAATQHAGTIVVDNLLELERLQTLFARDKENFPNLWLRLRPGLPVQTHVYTQTGQSDSKFGLDFSEALDALRLCLGSGLRVTGLHFHQGSHFHDPSPVGVGLDGVLDFIQEAHSSLRWQPETLCPGGGWGVAYHESELPHPSVEAYVNFVCQRIIQGCQQRGLSRPGLQLEPGRSLVARAGVAIYRLGAVKQTGSRRWLLIDGGMADNPRPALYGARYSALPVSQPDRLAAQPAWLGGPFCESGDVLIENLPMPEMQPGELIAIPVSGAYHLSMGSNYNGACKPAVLWLDAGQASIIQRRETLQDLIHRDHPLP